MDLVISHVYKDFGRGPVLRDVSLAVRQGETVCLMGPSGLGKTTLLRCVAGLEPPGNRPGPAGGGDPPASGGAGPGRKRPAAGVAAVRRHAPPGGHRPGRVRRAAASAAGRGLQGPGRSVPPGHRGLYPPPYAGGVPAVRHPRPGGGRPAGGPLSGPVRPMTAIWNRKNVSHSETFR